MHTLKFYRSGHFGSAGDRIPEGGGGGGGEGRLSASLHKSAHVPIGNFLNISLGNLKNTVHLQIVKYSMFFFRAIRTFVIGELNLSPS